MKNLISNLNPHHKKHEKNDVNEQTQLDSNDKIQQDYINHKSIMKKLATTSKAFHKISKSYFQIKTNVLNICQILSTDMFNGISVNSGKALLNNICHINSSISDHCEQYATQFQNMVNLYSDLAKDKQQKYKQQRHNYNHYAQKIQVICRVTDKDRYERNKDKLKQARSSYDKALNQFSQFLQKINDQAQKIWQKSFVNFISVYMSKSEQMISKVKQTIVNYHDENDPSFFIQQQNQISLSPANSFNQIGQPVGHPSFKMGQQIHKFLSRNIHTQRVMLKDLFEHRKEKQNAQLNQNTNSNLKVLNNQKNILKKQNADKLMFGSLNEKFKSQKNKELLETYGSTNLQTQISNSCPTNFNTNKINISMQKLFGAQSMKIQPVSFSNIFSNYSTNKKSNIESKLAQSKASYQFNNSPIQAVKIDQTSSNNVSTKLGQNQGKTKNQNQKLLKPPKNLSNFDTFQNIFCQKSKSPVQRPRQKTPNTSKPVFTLVNNPNYMTLPSSSTQNKNTKKPKQQINLLDL